ncbi:MAG: aminoacyl-tRNA hydrolase [Patescibacteria group bacterium]|nr:aminoacyl-tRNA hydrolase [Patescibacteria group bacterium]
MKLIVGLGNPGKQYEKTRHNLGFMVLEQFLKDNETVGNTVWENNTRFKSDMAEFTWQPKHGDSEKVILLKPKTFMNNSGMAIQLVADFYKIGPEDIWVIHDDVDLKLGMLRIRNGGGSGGHRGIESVLQVFPQGNFWRFRCGIGRPQQETADAKGVDDYVLGNFNHEEHGKIRELLHHVSKALHMGLGEGLPATMNKFNTK